MQTTANIKNSSSLPCLHNTYYEVHLNVYYIKNKETKVNIWRMKRVYETLESDLGIFAV